MKFMRCITYIVFVRWIDFHEIKVTFEIHVKEGLYMANHFKKLMEKFRKTEYTSNMLYEHTFMFCAPRKMN
jgi:hypothetical protein